MVRVCPERDAQCPHGDDCPYMADRYRCDMSADERASFPLPHEVMIWFSNPDLCHAGTWATTRYPEDAQRYVAAGAVEQFLTEGETVEQRMNRFHQEILGLLKYLEHVKRKSETDRDDVLEVAARVAASRYQAPPPGIHGFEGDVYAAGMGIADAIRALKGGA